MTAMTGFTPSRRCLLQGAALWGAVAAATPFRRALGKTTFSNDPFQLGVASGDPVADGFVIWTRIAPAPLDPQALAPEALRVAWEVAEDAGMKKIVKRGEAWARPEMAHAVHVDVRGLAPARPYYYRFHCDGAVSRTGRGMTLPRPGSPVDRLKFAFASCAHYEQGYFSAYRDMAAQDPAFILHLGDYIYEVAVASAVRRHPAATPPMTLDQYRAFHAAYKSDPDLQDAHAHTSWFFTWDDHEVANDYSRTESRATPPETFPPRRLAAYKAYYEHMPLRAAADLTHGAMTMYQRVQFGDLAEFNITDARQYRDPLPCSTPDFRGGKDLLETECEAFFDPARTMLGRGQEDWLYRGFAAAGARWNVLAHSLMFADFDQRQGPGWGTFTDSWSGYQAARTRLMDTVVARKAQNVITLAGDIHSFFVNEVKQDRINPAVPALMTEFVTSSVTSDVADPETFDAVLPENPHIKFCEPRKRGYVLCTLDKDAWRADMRAADNVRERDTAFRTAKSFVVENGKPGPQAA